ncbi:uncharacterized protein LOC6041115 [Culex quinquefasciatus]|uniref:uncharacterized protein LOC6041115 n=1 Tax=Culex quinquefasciatus TaxID=7176 RepID=UPI0018E2CFCE|nr:uncharacterized protein LOC6041115 [Culex quinquefasciatus]
MYEANLKPLPWPMPFYGSVTKNSCGFAFTVVFLNMALNESGKIRKLLEHQYLVPLGKLSYTVYHINFLLLTGLVGAVRDPLHLDLTKLIISMLSVTVLSYGLGLVMFLLVEQPAANLLGSKTRYFGFAGNILAEKTERCINWSKKTLLKLKQKRGLTQ